MKHTIYVTDAKLTDLKKELDSLLSQRSPTAERIRLAREFGDLSENAEYMAARQDQERLELRISEIERILRQATIIFKPRSKQKVGLGSTVTIRSNTAEKAIQIVGTIEVDPLNNKISDESPFGKQLLGKAVHDHVTISTPLGTTEYTIVGIE